VFRRSLAILVVLLVAAGCTRQAKADNTDRQRISAMKSEPVVAGLNGIAHEGAGDGGDYSVNSYSAYPVSGVAAATPVAAREQAAAILGKLRSQGWTVISARCAVAAPGSYTWEAFAYKVRDQVPYAAHMTAGYSRDSGLSVNVTQQAPFHADTKPRFQPAPAALASGTCVEQGDVEHPAAAQGTTWSLG
jgi:hypothetical protein